MGNPIDATSTESLQADKSNDMFLITVNSKESAEQNIANDVISAPEESENKPIIEDFATTAKYHAIYKDPETNNKLDNTEYVTVSTTPAVRNIKTVKSSRTRVKSYDIDEETAKVITPRTRDRSSRKYSESFSKTTEASTNGVSIF